MVAVTSLTQGAYCEIALADLTFGGSLRSRGLDQDHVAVLAETGGRWPPVLVWGGDNLVLDGCHRVEAARRLGLRAVVAERYIGTGEDAYLEALQRNIAHGLPLGLDDRRRAAERLLHEHADWSDRRIAALCGLSGKTVARVRRHQGDGQAPAPDASTAKVVDMSHRVGLDGKRRPVRAADVRERIEQALEENPDGSLRAVALAAGGASPETVRRVRASWRCRSGKVAAAVPQDEGSVPATTWQHDPALMSTDECAQFSRWFGGTNVDDEWHRYVWAIPIGRVYEVVDEARRRAACWTSFASLLESRARS